MITAMSNTNKVSFTATPNKLVKDIAKKGTKIGEELIDSFKKSEIPEGLSPGKVKSKSPVRYSDNLEEGIDASSNDTSSSVGTLAATYVIPSATEVLGHSHDYHGCLGPAGSSH